MSEINRYITDQVKVYINNCEEESSSSSSSSSLPLLQSMIVISSNSLIQSQLLEISIKGNSNFRFNDEIITFMIENLIKSNISLCSLFITHHNISDVGFIQICRLILVFALFLLSFLSISFLLTYFV